MDCTYPHDVTRCGCGNACGEDGLCQTCGANGAGCSTDEIYCCSDSDCSSGTKCSTLSSSSDGYHLCLPLESCSTADDCAYGEICKSGYCRDDVSAGGGGSGGSASECSAGQYDCEGDTLKACSGGSWQYLDCYDVCFDADLYFDHCGYSSNKGHDTCICTEI